MTDAPSGTDIVATLRKRDVPFQTANDLLLERNIYVPEDALREAVQASHETLGLFTDGEVDDRVRRAVKHLHTDAEFERYGAERYQAGKDAMRVKSKQVADAISILRETREMLQRMISWSGRADWRDRQLERVDDLIAFLES